jgi:hypothetical protein
MARLDGMRQLASSSRPSFRRAARRMRPRTIRGRESHSLGRMVCRPGRSSWVNNRPVHQQWCINNLVNCWKILIATTPQRSWKRQARRQKSLWIGQSAGKLPVAGRSFNDHLAREYASSEAEVLGVHPGSRYGLTSRETVSRS